ncbi:MAG: hypothetical protein HAW58_00570 [Candidatus Thioglobus sp.]|nr:hypothetical protein [Candidatus Thioglobus sp.]
MQKALKNSNSKYILLTLHHPIVPLKSTWDDDLSLENPQELFEILDKYPKIQAVIFGHAHQAGEFRRKNLRIFSCPSTAKQFDAEDKIGFNHYQLGDNGKIKMQTKWLKMAKN